MYRMLYSALSQLNIWITPWPCIAPYLPQPSYKHAHLWMTNLCNCFSKWGTETSPRYCFLTHLKGINIFILALAELFLSSIKFSFIFPQMEFWYKFWSIYFISPLVLLLAKFQTFKFPFLIQINNSKNCCSL